MAKAADAPPLLRAATVEEAERLVAATRTVHAVCAVRGHRWPEIDPEDKRMILPEGYVVGPIREDGLFDIREYCLRHCGEYKSYLARPEDVFGRGIRRSYNRPKDRPVIARDLSRDVWGTVLSGRMSERIMAAAKKATEAANRAAAVAENNGGRAAKGAV